MTKTEARALLQACLREGREPTDEENRALADALGTDPTDEKTPDPKPDQKPPEQRKDASGERSTFDRGAMLKLLADTRSQTTPATRTLGRDETFESRYCRPGDPPQSLGKTLRGIFAGDWTDAEIEQRATGMSGSAGAYGAYTLSQPTSSKIWDRTRAGSCVMQAGATILPMESRTLDLAVVDTDPTVYSRGEGVAITESDIVFARRTLSARSLGVLISCSKELLDDVDELETTITDVMAQAIAKSIDTQCLSGRGADGEILGLYNVSGITDSPADTNGTAVTRALITSEWPDFFFGPASNDAVAGAVLVSPGFMADFDALAVASTEDTWLGPLSFQKAKFITSSHVGSTFTHGTSDVCTALFCGQWDRMVIGLRSRLEIAQTAAATATSFAENKIHFRAIARVDMAVVQPSAFARLSGFLA